MAVGEGSLGLSVEQEPIAAAARALRAEADGRELRRELTRQLRAAMNPIVADARAAARAIPSGGGHAGTPLRPAVARAVRPPVVRLSGKNPNVAIRVGMTPQVRGFRSAPRRLNKASWRHPVYGNRAVWVRQVGRPGWFDDTVRGRREEFRDQVLDVVKAMTDRIAARSRT